MQIAAPTDTENAEGAGSSRARVQLAGFSAATQTPPKRNQSLDVLRCVAILLVLGRHAQYYALWGKIGWIGVDLFFVLSGFLISGLLFEDYKAHGTINLRRFVLRRGLKIWPPFIVFLSTIAVIFALGSTAFPRHGFITSVFFVRNYFPSDVPPVGIAHIWSLCVEEHFYVFLPALLVSIIAIRRKSSDPFDVLPYLFMLIALVCLVLRCTLHGTTPYVWKTHERIDSLFAGVTLGYLYHFKSAWFQKLASHQGLLLGLLFCVPAVIFDEGTRVMRTFGLTSLALGFALLVAWCVVRAPRTNVGRITIHSAAKIGFYSYSIYLWHLPIANLLKHRHSATIFWMYIASVILLGIAMAKLIEIPALRMRERWRLTA